MKANEFLKEEMYLYDKILLGLLKIVAHMDKTSQLPFGKYTPKGSDRSIPRVNAWGLLNKIGLGYVDPDYEFRYPETREMITVVNPFVAGLTSGSNVSITKNDIEPVAKSIYSWIQSMKKREHKL